MKIPVKVTVEFSDDAAERYAVDFGLLDGKGQPSQRKIAEHVRSWSQADLQRSTTGEYAEIKVAGA